MEGQSSHASTNPTTTTTTSSDVGTRCLNGDMVWEWGVWKDPTKKSNIWCTLCDKKVCGGITRLKQHLSHIPGEVSKCPNVAPDIMKKVKRKAKKKQRNIEILRSSSIIGLFDNEDEEDEIRVRDDSKKRNPIDCVYKSDRGKAHQITLDKNNPIKQKLKNIAWKKFAIWAYAVGLPFNVVRDESFQDVIDAIGDYGKGMPAPSYHNVQVTLQKEVLQDTNKFVDQRACSPAICRFKKNKFVDSFRPQWQKHGCSIMSGFWIDGKGRALINFLVNFPTGTVFLKLIDASEHVKDAQLIVKMINQVIEDVGEENIAHFLTDNGSNYKATGKFLEEQHPKLFWTPCATHYVNLMIQHIGEKIKKIKGALTDARAIVIYIYNHGRILNMMRKLAKNKELNRSCITSVHENRHLQVLFVSEQWTKCAFVNKVVGMKVERIFAKQAFWDDVYFSYQVFAPLLDMIRLVDRWYDQLHHPLHAAGCFLNPAIFHGENSEIEKNKDIVTGLYVAIDRLTTMNIYIDSEGQFGSATSKRNIDIWWRSYGIDTHLLQNFAIKLHSTKRNCLLQQKLNDLVFIQYNTRLQRRFESLKSNKTDPILLRDVEENDEWTIPTEDELQDFVDSRDGLLWSDVRETMGGNVDIGPSTRIKRERYRDDDDDNDQTRVEVEDDVYVDLDVEVNALDDVDSKVEPVDCD
uniref:DUF659 domain-containing protein n=1 Tax=Lactuca sativa TaxID=4236 RepID=A0A9R1XAJ4_LACSA|nr:hypothetical protein LSAT_V11C500271280 [Lactuca sativa]